MILETITHATMQRCDGIHANRGLSDVASRSSRENAFFRDETENRIYPMSSQTRSAASFRIDCNGDIVSSDRHLVPLRVHPQRTEWRLSHYGDKQEVIAQLERLLEGDGGPIGFLRQRAALMADEMLENALVAAARGTGESRPGPEPGGEVTFCLFFDGERLALEVTDPWGRLSSERVRDFLRMNLAETHPVEDRSGRGLFFMWQFMEDFYVSVIPGVETSVGGLLQLHQH
jgi:anti-sigma regulatory factor (Ser/Thr protein kinase)